MRIKVTSVLVDDQQKALYDAGIPLTMFHVDDLDAEYARLAGLGVAFSVPPIDAAPSSTRSSTTRAATAS
ncbi:MAG TPA: hypothetical protein VIS07_23165 [Candidatus Binatia bacterium]